jgi:hypothetical protein
MRGTNRIRFSFSGNIGNTIFTTFIFHFNHFYAKVELKLLSVKLTPGENNEGKGPVLRNCPIFSEASGRYSR